MSTCSLYMGSTSFNLFDVFSFQPSHIPTLLEQTYLNECIDILLGVKKPSSDTILEFMRKSRTTQSQVRLRQRNTPTTNLDIIYYIHKIPEFVLEW